MPGRTRGRCGWVSAVTTDRARGRRVPGCRPHPGEGAGRSPRPLLSGAPRTRPLASGAPRILHRARALAAPSSRPRGGAPSSAKSIWEGPRVFEARPARPSLAGPQSGPPHFLSRREGGDTPRAGHHRRLLRPLAAAAGTRPGHAGQSVWAPLPRLGARGGRRAVSARIPWPSPAGRAHPPRLPRPRNSGLPSREAALRESARLGSLRQGGGGGEGCLLSRRCAPPATFGHPERCEKCRMHALIYLFCNSCKQQ